MLSFFIFDMFEKFLNSESQIIAQPSRLSECLALRVKDIDLDRREILVRDGKGRKVRRTMLSEVVIPRLKTIMKRTKHLHEIDLIEGLREVDLPYALAKKYPKAAKDFAFQFVFASEVRSTDRP